MTIPTNIQSLSETGQDDQMALDSRYKIIQGAGEEEDWSVCFFFAFLRLDDALQGVENRTVLANFQQKSMQTIYPQDR